MSGRTGDTGHLKCFGSNMDLRGVEHGPEAPEISWEATGRQVRRSHEMLRV